jgi:hypothetical protein
VATYYNATPCQNSLFTTVKGDACLKPFCRMRIDAERTIAGAAAGGGNATRVQVAASALSFDCVVGLPSFNVDHERDESGSN